MKTEELGVEGHEKELQKERKALSIEEERRVKSKGRLGKREERQREEEEVKKRRLQEQNSA